MTNQPPAESVHDGWTIATYAIHKEALRQADARFAEERDRRYAEVALEREKALKIKEEADKAALGLAREIQTYKDEKANELREQINSERGNYMTRSEMKPFTDYVTSQQGRDKGIGLIVGGAVIVLGMGFTMLSLLAGLAYFIARG
jgi:hypothetical protein